MPAFGPISVRFMEAQPHAQSVMLIISTRTGDCPGALGASKITAKVIAILENMIVRIHFERKY